MVGLRCGLRKVQGDVGISHCIRNQGASKIKGVMSKITGAGSEELPVTKIVAVYAGGNNYSVGITLILQKLEWMMMGREKTI